jgi:two-component system nitrogen regulation response regulator GlnG
VAGEETSDLLGSTFEPERGRAARARWTVPGLTIVYHPETRRIGDSARLVEFLEGRGAAVSRLAPTFVAPGAASGEALAHRSVSRRRLLLEPRGEGVRLQREADLDVAVGGTPLVAPRDIGADEIERGVVIELGTRVVLLLHRLGSPVAPLPRFGLVGDSEALERVRADINRIAGLPVPVLLCGESGTGKELVARAIQQASPRAKEAFVSVNMAAIPPAIAASELFGHGAGAFTGASRSHSGYFAQANGGTLFLDEVGETPPDVQAMLLRVLETSEIQPLGSTNRAKVDVRVIAATESDLAADVSAGRFRESLLYRLAGYQVFLPALRERRDDVGRLLLHRFTAELEVLGELQRLAQLAGPDPWLPASLVAALARHDWPGNVRQLCNVARHLVIASRGGHPVHLEDLPAALLGERASRRAHAPVTAAQVLHRTPASAPLPPEQTKPIPSADQVLAVLRANSWRTSATARQLGISRTTLYKLIDRHPTIRKAKDLSAEEIRSCAAASGGDAEAMAAALEVSPHGLLLRMKELEDG